MSHAGQANPGIPAEGARAAPPWWWSLAAGLLFTIATILAFPPFSLWGLVFLAPVGLLHLGLNAGPRPGRAGLLAAAGVMPFWLVQMRYINDITAAGYVPLAIWFSVFTWLFVWLLATCLRAFPRVPAPALIAVLWTAIDVLRGDVLFTGFPWYYLAHPLIDVPWLVRPATTVGAYGLTLLIAALVAGLVGLARRDAHQRRGVLVTIGCAALIWVVLSFLNPASTPPRTLRAGIVQTNLPQSNKMGWSFKQRLLDMERFEALTRLAAAPVADQAGHLRGPDVIVWPETMFPGHLDPQAVAVLKQPGEFIEIPGPQGPEKIPAHVFAIFAERLMALQAELGIPMVVGAIGLDHFRIEPGTDGLREFKHDAKYNSTFLISGGRVQARYDKIALTPFGEVMPGIRYWPWLQHKVLVLAAQGMAFDLSAGNTPVTLDIPSGDASELLRTTTPICFEITRGQFCRDLVIGPGGRRADLFVNLTNDGWFANADSGRSQHLQLARWRCLETGTPMVRAANTGISAVIDASGRVLARGVDGDAVGLNVDGVLTHSLPVSTIPTFFARHGDLVRWPVLGAAACTVLAAFWGSRRAGRQRRPAGSAP